MQSIHIAFHTDPIDQEPLLRDVQRYGFAHLDTTRTNAQRIGNELSSIDPEVICLAVRGPDDDHHYYLVSLSVADHDLSATKDQVLRAILAWHSDGRPLPSVRALQA